MVQREAEVVHRCGFECTVAPAAGGVPANRGDSQEVIETPPSAKICRQGVRQEHGNFSRPVVAAMLTVWRGQVSDRCLVPQLVTK